MGLLPAGDRRRPEPPSVGNFVLVHFPALADQTEAEHASAADAFLRRAGILVRGVKGYGLPAALRITIGTTDENRAVVAALAKFMQR